jgi:putative tricarboxylic transport membrane protein
VSEGDRSRGGARSGFLAPLAFAVAVLALGVVVLIGTFGLSAGGGYSPVGPGFFPLVVAGGLLVFGLAFLVRTTVSPDAYLREKAAAESGATHWPTVGLLLMVLIAYAFALDPLGYVFATAVFFPAAAFVLGDRRSRGVGRNLVIGLVVGVVIFFGFTELLEVRLPDGLLDPFL